MIAVDPSMGQSVCLWIVCSREGCTYPYHAVSNAVNVSKMAWEEAYGNMRQRMHTKMRTHSSSPCHPAEHSELLLHVSVDLMVVMDYISPGSILSSLTL